MLNTLKIYNSQSFQPDFNLAFEEYLLENTEPDTMVLYLWQNENTIVVGRHQNPYKECSISRLKNENVRLVRRLSGGGAVYHDLGNLNFTFVGNSDVYDVERQCGVILKALATFGLEGKMSGRNDLTIDEQKFSGNAFVNHGDMHCHHGTLLVNVDMDKLARYLTVSDLKIKSKGVDSVRSRVVNLADLNPDIRIENLKTALSEAFESEYGLQAERMSIDLALFESELSTKIQRYSAWEWNFSHTPNFEIEQSIRFDWGIVDLSMNSEDGHVTACKLFSDCLLDEDFHRLAEALVGLAFRYEDIETVLETLIRNHGIKADLKQWFEQLLG